MNYKISLVIFLSSLTILLVSLFAMIVTLVFYGLDALLSIQPIWNNYMVIAILSLIITILAWNPYDKNRVHKV